MLKFYVIRASESLTYYRYGILHRDKGYASIWMDSEMFIVKNGSILNSSWNIRNAKKRN